MKTQSRKLHTH